MLVCKAMPKRLDPFRFLLMAVAGWMNQQQENTIECLREENRALRSQLGNRRVRFTDDQRRSLAAKASLLARKRWAEVATVVTPESLLEWHRKLIASKYDGSAGRRPGRPTTKKEIEALVTAERQRSSFPSPCGTPQSRPLPRDHCRRCPRYSQERPSCHKW